LQSRFPEFCHFCLCMSWFFVVEKIAGSFWPWDVHLLLYTEALGCHESPAWFRKQLMNCQYSRRFFLSLAFVRFWFGLSGVRRHGAGCGLSRPRGFVLFCFVTVRASLREKQSWWNSNSNSNSHVSYLRRQQSLDVFSCVVYVSRLLQILPLFSTNPSMRECCDDRRVAVSADGSVFVKCLCRGFHEFRLNPNVKRVFHWLKVFYESQNLKIVTHINNREEASSS
jgi:hypothetical protein